MTDPVQEVKGIVNEVKQDAQGAVASAEATGKKNLKWVIAGAVAVAVLIVLALAFHT